MTDLITRILAWHHSRDRGATAVEYGLIVAAIAAVIVVVVVTLGDQIAGAFTTVSEAIGG